MRGMRYFNCLSLATSQHLFLSIVIRNPSFQTILIVRKPVRAKQPRCVTYELSPVMSIEYKLICWVALSQETQIPKV